MNDKLSMEKNVTTLLISMLLLLTIAISTFALPTAIAHTPSWTIPTYAYIVAAPNPIGVGQTVSITFWVDKVPPTADGPYGFRFHDLKVTVTNPSGTTDDLGTFDSGATGGAWTSFTPDQIGTYTFNFTFPTQTVKLENPPPSSRPIFGNYDSYINDTYLASSASTTLTVQSEPLSVYPANPLPSEYWTRPINSMNREWSSIGGNWLGLATGNFAPYSTAPDSAHVIWTKPLAFGGQIGGEFGSSDASIYATGTAYEAKFKPIIINGVLYYTQYPGAANNFGPLTAVDLHTGQTLWTTNASDPLLAGMVYNFQSGNQYGAHTYLFTGPSFTNRGFVISLSNQWSMYDAMTGQWILNIANVSSGTLVSGPNGELLSYNVANGKLRIWNASRCIGAGMLKNSILLLYGPEEIWRPPQGATIDWNDGYQWSVPLPTNISGNPISSALSVAKVSDNVVVVTSNVRLGEVPGGSQTGSRIDAGYDATTGQLLWAVNRTLTPYTNVPLGPAGEGVYTDYTAQTMTWTAYNIKTGAKLWGPTTPYNNSWGYYDNDAKGIIGYGNLYTWSINGEVHAYNLQTGALNWSWTTGSSGLNTPYGIWPLGTWGSQSLLADGKLYVMGGHDFTPPVFKGAKLYALNATSGDEIWSSLSFNINYSPCAVADGIMVWVNGYDNQIYSYGLGPSKTTVNAPNLGVTTGTPITITGTVTDISAGTKQDAVASNFPNGLPCVSDVSMSRFMEAVYQQQPMPNNVTGVPITLSVLDSNGNYRTIGTTTSTGIGTFAYTWTPDISGSYTIYATFTGSGGYYGSSAETHIYASEPAATPTPQPTQLLSMADLYFVPGIIGVIVAIIVVGAAIILLQRKRP